MVELPELIERQAEVVAKLQGHLLQITEKAGDLSTPGHPYWDALKVQSNVLASAIDKYATLTGIGATVTTDCPPWQIREGDTVAATTYDHATRTVHGTFAMSSDERVEEAAHALYAAGPWGSFVGFLDGGISCATNAHSMDTYRAMARVVLADAAKQTEAAEAGRLRAGGTG